MVANLPLGIMRKTSDGVYGYTRASRPEFESQMPQLDLTKVKAVVQPTTGIMHKTPDGVYAYRVVSRPEFQDSLLK